MEEIIKLTEDLIRFKTMHSQPAEIKRCISFIEDFLKTFKILKKDIDIEIEDELVNNEMILPEKHKRKSTIHRCIK